MLTAATIALMIASTSPAQAQDAPTRVFVSPFIAETREATSIASLMSGFLRQQLDAHAELDAIGADEVGPIFDTSAQLYLDSCPAGDQVGCAFVVGEVAHAEYALTGSVDSAGDVSRVNVIIIDVLESRQVISFQADLAVGDDVVFADGVARILVAVVSGEAGRSADIRDTDDSASRATTQARRQAEIAAQLDQLSLELGDVTTLSTRTEMEIERPRFTIGDLSDRMDQEGVKPWERLDMKPREYLRYKNSSLSLRDWRQRAMGRQGQLILRAGLGAGTGPSHGEYYGLFARSDQDLNVMEAYSYQAVTSGSGYSVAASASYGILPFLEVGAHLASTSGRYSLLIDSYVVGDEHTLNDPELRSNSVFSIGPQILGVLLPTSIIRPVVGLDADFSVGTTITSRYGLPVAELDGFSRPTWLSVGGRVGVEARITDQIDLFLHLPFGAVVAGQSSQSTRVGSDGLDVQDIIAPPSLSPIYAGVTGGIQIRLGGKKAKTGGVLDSSMM
ncbi:MAG: hypothetical protein GXP62_03295 [Oligoflexia bacterium]|nr:hypothetical protein [Oligoflexia bacterium]